MKPRIWTTVGDLRWLRPLELSHNFCRAISWNARLLYPTKAAVPTVRHRGSYGHCACVSHGRRLRHLGRPKAKAPKRSGLQLMSFGKPLSIFSGTRVVTATPTKWIADLSPVLVRQAGPCHTLRAAWRARRGPAFHWRSDLAVRRNIFHVRAVR
jgi:hypothetical protein